jgi:hypothetical protein
MGGLHSSVLSRECSSELLRESDLVRCSVRVI